MRQSRRKGFFLLYDITAWIVLGVILSSIVAFSIYYIVSERKQIDTFQSELRVKTFLDQSLYYVPQTKSVAYTTNSVTLNLFNGCTLTINYDSSTKEVFYTGTCPPGKTITPPGGKVKVDSFTLTPTPEGVKLVVCKNSACYSYFYRGM